MLETVRNAQLRRRRLAALVVCIYAVLGALVALLLVHCVRYAYLLADDNSERVWLPCKDVVHGEQLEHYLSPPTSNPVPIDRPRGVQHGYNKVIHVVWLWLPRAGEESDPFDEDDSDGDDDALAALPGEGEDGDGEFFFIPNDVQYMAAKWKKVNPDWNVQIWSNENVRTEFPELAPLLLRALPHAAWASDIVRYHVLARYGGLYVDTDMEPLRPLPANLFQPDAASWVVCEKPWGSVSCCALVGSGVISVAEADKPLMRLIARDALKQTREALRDRARFTTAISGPFFLSQRIEHSAFRILPSHTFFPCPFFEHGSCQAKDYDNDTQVIAMHRWDGSWKS